jgi:hypothetical protein
LKAILHGASKKSTPGKKILRGQLQSRPRNEMTYRNESAAAELFLSGSGFGGGVCVFLGETLDAASGVYQLLLSGKERMATGADFHFQHVALDG